MRSCTRAGFDVTFRCNWRCEHCFYRHGPHCGATHDVAMGEILAKMHTACEGGLDHAVMVGYGEPALCGVLWEVLDHCHAHGMATSMITNGSVGLAKYKRMRAAGMDHLHVSAHGLGPTLDKIAGVENAGRRQLETLDWLASEGWTYRTNTSLQQANYRELPAIVEALVERGAWHVVLLGFLVHYEWQQDFDRIRAVAVHPAELRPYIEAAADVALAAGRYLTIRYQPLCHLSPQYWPFVTNARHVFMDPWEWNYELQATDPEALWNASVNCGRTVAVEGEPCRSCAAYRHCGGWNRFCVAAYDGAGLAAIDEVPAAYTDVWQAEGGLHDLNPVNALTGTIADGG